MLSIIIPTKNEEDYLPLLLDSLKIQTYSDYEILVADANSSDDTVRLAKRYGCKVVSGGYPDVGRNSGAENASLNSDLFLFVDSDVVFPSNSYLERALMEFEEKEFDVASGLVKPFSVGNKFRDFLHNAFYAVNNYGIKDASGGKYPLMANVMFSRRKVHEAIGGFQPLEFGEDSKYAQDAVEKEYKFGVVRKNELVNISPRRLVNQGFLNMLYISIYFNLGRILFHKEFYRGKSKKKYF